MAASNLLLLRDGLLPAAPDAGEDDEGQRFHGLPPLKRFKMLRKEMKDPPPPPPSSPPIRHHRPAQVCCLPAKKRVCALRSFASIVDEVVDDEENGNKENRMERFEKYALNEKIESCLPSLFPDDRGDLASNSLYEVSNSMPAKVRSSLAPMQLNMPNDSMSAQKNGECAKRIVRPSKKDDRSFKENRIESKKVHKSSEPTEETCSNTQLNLVHSCKVRKKLKKVSEKRKSKETDQSISSKNGGIYSQTKIFRELSRREEASSACAIAKNDQKSFSRKRGESNSNGSKEAGLKRERLIHENEKSVAEVKERQAGKLKVYSLKRKKEVHNSSLNRRMEQDSSKSDGFHFSKGINLSKKSGESLLKVMKRTQEGLLKVSSKRQEQTSSEKRNHHGSQMLSQKMDFSVYGLDFATTRGTEKDGYSSQLEVLTKSGVHLNVQGKGCTDLKPCLQKKRRELNGCDSSNLFDVSKDQFKGSDSVKTIAERKYQFKENDPSLPLVNKKGQSKGNHFKVSCVEGNDQVKRHTPKLSCMEMKDKPCLEGEGVNLCHSEHQKKVSPEEALDSVVKKGHHSNSEKLHNSVNVVSQHCFTSDKTHCASGNNACKEDQSAEDKKTNEVDDEDEEDDGVFCDVCKEGDADEEDPIVFCDGCDVMVHASCYGNPLIDGIPEGDWFCKQCIKKKEEKKTASPNTTNESDASSVCCLCPKRGGVMKETMEGAWAHLSCALFVPEVFYRKAREREEIECDQVPSWRWKLPCIFCRKNVTNKDDDGCGKGACIQCTEVGCTSTFHVSCAMDEGLSLDILIGNGGSKSPAIVIAFCPTHSQETLSGSERRRFKIVPRV